MNSITCSSFPNYVKEHRCQAVIVPLGVISSISCIAVGLFLFMPSTLGIGLISAGGAIMIATTIAIIIFSVKAHLKSLKEENLSVESNSHKSASVISVNEAPQTQLVQPIPFLYSMV